jgi:chromosome segregation ATPase
MAKDRKTELTEQIADLRARYKAAVGETQKHETALSGHKRDLERLAEERSRHCENEAQGFKSDRAPIESQISTVSARAHGCERLRDAKHAEAQAIETQVAPLERELRDLGIQEEVNKQLGEIAELEKQAMAVITERDGLNRRVVEIEADLRDRGFHPAISHASAEAAERISRVFRGMRP